MNVNKNNTEEDESDEDQCDESKLAKKFNAILKDIKNDGRTSKSINIKSHGNSINLYPLVIKLLNAGKSVIKKDYGFDKVFNIFHEIDNNCHKLHEYNPTTFNKINRKNEKLDYLKIIKDNLIGMFSTPIIIRKINNAN